MYNRFLLRHLGAYYMLISSLLFAATGALGKILSAQMSSVEVVFFRNAIGLILITIVLIKNPPHQRGGKIWLLIFRAVVGVTSLLAFFYNIANIGLGEAFVYAKSAPIFLSVIAALFLGERMGKFGWVGIFVGFIGVGFIMQPNFGITKADFMGIINGFFAALAYTSVRELRKYYDPKVIVMIFVLFGTIVPAICMIVAQFTTIPALDFMIAKFVMPTAFGWILIVIMGALGVIFQTYMTKAYAVSRKAGVVSAVSYSDILFSMIFGLMLGDALPNALAWIGIALVVLSGLMVLREK